MKKKAERERERVVIGEGCENKLRQKREVKGVGRLGKI